MKSVKIAGTTAALLFSSLFVGTMFAQREGKDDHQDKGGGQQHAPGQQGRPAPQQAAPQGAQGRPAPQQAAPQQQQQRVQQQPQPQQRQQPQERTQQPQQQQRVQQAPQQQQQQRVQENPRQQRPEQQQRVQTPQVQQQQQQRVQQPQQQQQRGQQQQARVQPPQRSPQQAQAWQQQRGWQHGGASAGHQTFQQDRAQHWATEHRTWAQRGGYGGYYIPQDRFSLYFGSQHYFRIGILPTMYLGYPRFSYGGFTFLLLDPYPEYWSTNWYDADDLYIDYDAYDGGYYLYNRQYPNDRLAVAVQM